MRTAIRVLAGSITAALVVTAAPVSAVTDAKRPPLLIINVTAEEFLVRGGLTHGTGPIQFELNASGYSSVTVFSKKPSYSMRALRKDVDLARQLTERRSPTGAKAYKRLQNNVVTHGGVQLAGSGLPMKATLVLNPGTYYLGDNEGSGFGRLKTLRITDKPNGARMPKWFAEITMTGKKSFGGDTTLSHHSTVKITNTLTSGARWYIPTLVAVEEGTTARQVRAWMSGGNPDAGFVKGHLFGGDTLSPGRSQLLNYNVAPGRYALICDLPDPDGPGTMYGSNGMIRMITLT